MTAGADSIAGAAPVTRYPGPLPYGDSPLDRDIFKGREREVEVLRQRVLGAKLLVLFGAAGVGKTSLLRAGLFQYLRDKECLPVPVLLAPGASVRDGVVSAMHSACRDPANAGAELTEVESADLWTYLQSVLVWKGELLLTPVLVFDQFEDVFGRQDAAFRRELADQLGALVSGVAPAALDREPGAAGPVEVAAGGEGEARRGGPAPRVKIVLSISEDCLGALEELSPLIPGLFQDRVRLSGLSEACARQAICEPAALVDEGGRFGSPAFAFDAPALRALLDFLLGSGTQIDPYQLQLLCRHAEQVAGAKARAQPAAGVGAAPATATVDGVEPSGPALVLTLADLGGANAFAQVLKHFYRDATARLPWRQRRRVRRLCEEGLVSSTGTRQLLEEGAILEEYALSLAELEQLGKGRWQLLRRERRLESWFYEVAHERLAASIVQGRSFRLPKRLRNALWGAGTVALITIGVLLHSNVQIRNARDAEAAARSQADDLAGFLLGEEFLERLRLVGRSSMLDSVQQRVDRHLPSEEEAAQLGPSSLRNRALAQRNRGQLLEARGFLAEAAAQYDDARGIFERLVAQQPEVGEWLRELGRSARMLGDVRRLRGEVTLAARAFEQSETARRAVLNRPAAGGTALARLELADTLASQGSNLVDRGQPRDALPRFAEALKLLQDLGADVDDVSRRLVKFDAQDGYAQALDDLGQQKAAADAFVTALQTARELADAAPYLPKASYNLAVATSRVVNRDEGADRARALRQYAQIEDTLQKLVRWDPSNSIWRLDSAATTQLRAWAQQRADPKQGESASAAMDRACEVVAQIEREHPAEGRWKAAVADCFWSRGFLLSEQRKWRAAADQYVLAGQRYRAAASDPVQTRWPVEAVRASWYAAAMLMGDDPPAARALLADVREAAETLVGAHPDLIGLRGELVRELGREAELRASAGDAPGAAALRERATALAAAAPADQQREPRLLLSRAETELQQGRDALGRGEPDKALAMGRLAAEHAEAARAGRPKNADTQELLSRAHRLAADAHRARKDAKEEEAQRRAALGAAKDALALDPERAHRLNEVWLRHYELAQALTSSRRRDEALRELAAGFGYLERAIKATPAEVILHGNARSHWQQVATVQEQRGDSAAVEQARRHAVEAARKAVDVGPGRWNRDNELHVAHVELGDTLRAAKQDKAALEQFQLSLEPLKRALAQMPGEAVLHENLSGAWRRIAELQSAAGRPQDSLTARRYAVQAQRDAAALRPKDAEAAVQLARSYLQLARATRSSDAKETLHTAQRGVEAAAGALTIEPERPDALNLQALLLHEVAMSQIEQKDSRGAVDTYRRVVAIEAKAARSRPGDATYAANLYSLQERLADTLLALDTEAGRREALDQLRAAIAAAESAARLDSGSTAIRDDLQALKERERALARSVK